MLTLQEAAKQVGVSDKTLRRAIEAGKLTGHQRETGGKHNNQPIMIDEQDLEAYIASRQVTVVPSASSSESSLEARITELEAISAQTRNDALEQVIARMQEQVAIDHRLSYSRIDALEKRITELQELHLKTQEELLRQQQENITLTERVKALEPTMQGKQTRQESKPDEELEASLNHLVARERERHPERYTIQAIKLAVDNLEMPDFTKPWQSHYACRATRKDMWASMELRPYQGGEAQGLYIAHSSNGKIKPRGTVGQDQKFRGDLLERDLRDYVLAVMRANGWTEKTLPDQWGSVYQQPG